MFDYSISAAAVALKNADAVVIGAGAGLSAAAGLDIGIDAVRKIMPDYETKYGITNLYEGSFYPFPTMAEQWAYWAKAFYYWRFQVEVFPLYRKLLALAQKRNYFVITTNGDGQFLRAGFPREKVFLIQGDHGDFACSASCCDETYDSKPIFENMIAHTENLRVPDSCLPKCPHCGAPLMMRQRSGVRTLEIAPYCEERQRYLDFLHDAEGKKTVLLELGVGFNTPVHIKMPFWKLTAEKPEVTYIAVNPERPVVPDDISERTIYLQQSISDVISSLSGKI